MFNVTTRNNHPPLEIVPNKCTINKNNQTGQIIFLLSYVHVKMNPVTLTAIRRVLRSTGWKSFRLGNKTCLRGRFIGYKSKLSTVNRYKRSSRGPPFLSRLCPPLNLSRSPVIDCEVKHAQRGRKAKWNKPSNFLNVYEIKRVFKSLICKKLQQ